MEFYSYSLRGKTSAEALRDRMLDARCKILITADQGKRGGKAIHLKKIADDALKACPLVQVSSKEGG